MLVFNQCVCSAHFLNRYNVWKMWMSLESVGEKYDIISECGFTKPSRLSLSTDKIDQVQCIALHHVILKSLGELSQFCESLGSLGVLKAIQEHGELLRDFFVIKKSDLTAGMSHESQLHHDTYQNSCMIDIVRRVFTKVRFSEDGSNARVKEESAYMMFLEYLDECEKRYSMITYMLHQCNYSS